MLLQWLPNQSDFPPISWPLYRAWPSPIMSDYEWFPWSICNGCGMSAGNAYPSGHLVPSPIVGLACAPIVETRFLELAMSLLDFSPRIPLGTFSILLAISLTGDSISFWCCISEDLCLYVVLFLWYSNITIICHFYVFEEGDYIIESFFFVK